MVALGRLSAIVLLVLILGFATTAGAGTAQYSGSLIIQGFGNDTTNGTWYPYTTNSFLGLPFGITCNPWYGPGTKYCRGTTPEAQAGSPLTGSGTVSVTGTSPASFRLPQSGLAKKLGTPATVFETLPGGAKRPIRCAVTSVPGCGIPGGSLPGYPYYYAYTYADLKNAKGSFFKNNGPGALDWNFKKGGTYVANVVVKQGANRFGGTMQLLGHYYSSVGYAYGGGFSVGSRNWLWTKIGGPGSYDPKAPTVLVAPGTSTTTFTLYNTVMKNVVTSTVKAQYVGWTTGTVTVTALRGPFLSVMQRKGYDYRTSKGLGNIQLVSPLLTHWRGEQLTETTAVGILKLTFTPEPARWMMLVAGVSMLGLLYRAHRRFS